MSLPRGVFFTGGRRGGRSSSSHRRHGPLQFSGPCAGGMRWLLQVPGPGAGSFLTVCAAGSVRERPSCVPHPGQKFAFPGKFLSTVMAELRVVCRLFRYYRSAHHWFLFSDAPREGSGMRPADGFGDYASYRLDRGLPHRLHRIIHRRSHRLMDFRLPDHLRIAPDWGGYPAGYRNSARLWLFYGPDLYPSLGQDFRLGLRFRFRFAGEGDRAVLPAAGVRAP